LLNATGDEHGANPPASRRHANVAASFAWKANAADGPVATPSKGTSNDLLGAAVSATPVSSCRPMPATPVPDGSSTARILSPPPTASPPTLA
jgi:hypothetical protein